MKIYKIDNGYSLIIAEYISMVFDEYKTDSCGVMLYYRGRYAGQLSFDAATEFYKAWRAM
ncbi:MAG: hypothetical protein WA981_03795 [Glaciecola sp.]